MALLIVEEVSTGVERSAPFWMNPLFLLTVFLFFGLAAVGLVLWLVRMQSRKQRSPGWYPARRTDF